MALLGGAERNPLNETQLVRLWTPRARTTEPGRAPNARHSMLAGEYVGGRPACPAAASGLKET